MGGFRDVFEQRPLLGLAHVGGVLMMQVVYRAIIALILLLTVRCAYREKDFWKQATAALVVIPLVLRLLLIK